jgi:hypothetical protein
VKAIQIIINPNDNLRIVYSTSMISGGFTLDQRLRGVGIRVSSPGLIVVERERRVYLLYI